MRRSIYPCLWLAGMAKEAAAFYCSLFPGSAITEDTPMVVAFDLGGQHFMALNSRYDVQPNPSVSFFVVCETPEETDRLWEQLGADGTVLMPLDRYEWSERYGWVQDRFGVSWQVYLGDMSGVGQKICPLLMFCGEHQGQAAAAVGFYAGVFKDTHIEGILEYGEDNPDYRGQVMHSQFRLGEAVVMAMDSGVPQPFTFSEGVSLVVECDTQDEIDYYWECFTKEGEESMCGWCRDRFGVWWQIVPSILSTLMKDPEKAPGVLAAFLKMKKFDIETLLNS